MRSGMWGPKVVAARSMAGQGSGITVALVL